MLVRTAIHPLEVLRNCLVHLVLVADELVLHDDRPHDWVSALHSEDLLRSCVKSLQVVRSEESTEILQDLVVVQLPCQLKQLRRLIAFLRGGVPHRLPPFVDLRLVHCNDLLGDVVDHGSLVNEGGGVKHAVLQTVLDHLSDGGLRQAPGVHSLRLQDRYLLPLYSGSLHRHQDGAVVGDLVNGLSYNGVHDGYVPGPELVKMVALPVSWRTLSECRGESRSHQLLVNLRHLPIQVTSYDDLSLCILPDDALYKADDCLRSLHHKAFLARFKVYIEYVDFLPAEGNLGPVEVGAQRFHLAVVLEV